MTNTIGLEADHFQLRAIAEHSGTSVKGLSEQNKDPQLAQPG